MKPITKIYQIKAPVKAVFTALTDELQMEAWSGAETEIDNKPGGKFSIWGGSIHGVMKQIKPTRIVQDWKEAEWKDFTEVIFNLKDSNGGTELELIHSGVPDKDVDDIDDGWDRYYLGPLKKYLESKKAGK